MKYSTDRINKCLDTSSSLTGNCGPQFVVSWGKSEVILVRKFA